jgi:arylsulfatase A-like enzyme
MGEFSGYLSLLAVSAISFTIYFVAARIHRLFPNVDRSIGQRKGLRKLSTLVIGLGFVFLLWNTFHTSNPGGSRIPGSRPSVLLLVLDTARADRFSCYGYERDTTPFLKRLSKDATLYPETISAAAWTMPSHASIFTGLYPSAHGSTLKNMYLDDQFITLPEFLESKGYVTIGISNNPIVNLENGLAQGFEHYVEMWKDEVLNPTLFHRLDWLLKRFLGQTDGGALRTNGWVREWLNHVHRRDQPFFLFINLMESHLWNNAPKSYHEMFLREEYSPTVKNIFQRNLCSLLTGYLSLTFEEWIDFGDIYDGDLYYLDRRIEELFQFLEEDSFLDEMIIVITSDHGEHLGEHGMIGHITSLYEPLVRVPMIVKVSEGLPKLPEVKGIVQTVDIYPTLIELLGFEDDIPDGHFQGYSLVGAERSPHEYAIAEIESPESLISNFLKEYPEGKEILKYDRALKSMRIGISKYIWSSTGKHEFYNLLDDPEELKNLIAEKSTEADELEKRLKDWLISFEHAGVSEKGRELDAELLQKLKDLGYIN